MNQKTNANTNKITGKYKCKNIYMHIITHIHTHIYTFHRAIIAEFTRNGHLCNPDNNVSSPPFIGNSIRSSLVPICLGIWIPMARNQTLLCNCVNFLAIVQLLPRSGLLRHAPTARCGPTAVAMRTVFAMTEPKCAYTTGHVHGSGWIFPIPTQEK